MISTIVITRNEEKNILRTLKSLTHTKITEIIVSDSNSNDNTKKIVETEAKKDKRIRFQSYRSAPFTAARGRNEGAKLASPDAEYLLFIDGDMEVNTEFIDVALSEFNQDNKIAALSGQMHNYYYNENFELKKQELNAYNISDNKPGGAMIIKTSAYGMTKGYNSNLIVNEESELIHRITKAGYSFKRINSLMVIHHTEDPVSRLRLKERLMDRKITALALNVIVAVNDPSYIKTLLKENFYTFLTLVSIIVLIVAFFTKNPTIGTLQFLITISTIAVANKSIRIPINYIVYSIGLVTGLAIIGINKIKYTLRNKD